eukprot:715868-Pelagomonas_calceolata.AAC.1
MQHVLEVSMCGVLRHATSRSSGKIRGGGARVRRANSQESVDSILLAEYYLQPLHDGFPLQPWLNQEKAHKIATKLRLHAD